MNFSNWKLKDTYGMGFFIYFVKTMAFYGLLFLSLFFVFLASYANQNLPLLLWMAGNTFFHFFGQFAYGLPVYYLLKDVGYPKVARGFVCSSVIPLIILICIISYLLINYEWKDILQDKMWT